MGSAIWYGWQLPIRRDLAHRWGNRFQTCHAAEVALNDLFGGSDCQQMVQWWFGAHWFGTASPYEREYPVQPLGPKPPAKPMVEIDFQNS
jgi:hypothetical protein